MDRYPVGPEVALSICWVLLLTFGGWELYLGDKAFRCVTGEIQIPFHPPMRRQWDLFTLIIEHPLGGIYDKELSNGPCTSDPFRIWWRPLTIGPQTRATHFLSDIVPSSIMMSE